MELVKELEEYLRQPHDPSVARAVELISKALRTLHALDASAAHMDASAAHAIGLRSRSNDDCCALRAIICALEETETTLAAGQSIPPFALSAAAQLRLMSEELKELAHAVYTKAVPTEHLEP